MGAMRRGSVPVLGCVPAILTSSLILEFITKLAAAAAGG